METRHTHLFHDVEFIGLRFVLPVIKLRFICCWFEKCLHLALAASSGFRRVCWEWHTLKLDVILFNMVSHIEQCKAFCLIEILKNAKHFVDHFASRRCAQINHHILSNLLLSFSSYFWKNQKHALKAKLLLTKRFKWFCSVKHHCWITKPLTPNHIKNEFVSSEKRKLKMATQKSIDSLCTICIYRCHFFLSFFLPFIFVCCVLDFHFKKTCFNFPLRLYSERFYANKLCR